MTAAPTWLDLASVIDADTREEIAGLTAELTNMPGGSAITGTGTGILHELATVAADARRIRSGFESQIRRADTPDGLAPPDAVTESICEASGWTRMTDLLYFASLIARWGADDIDSSAYSQLRHYCRKYPGVIDEQEIAEAPAREE